MSMCADEFQEIHSVMSATISRKRKLSASAEGEAIVSGSPPRKRMRQDCPDLASEYELQPIIRTASLECPELPKEIWIEILTSVSSSPIEDPPNFSLVCRDWYELSKHQNFAWWNIKGALTLEAAKYLLGSESVVKIECLERRPEWLHKCFYNLVLQGGTKIEASAYLKQGFRFDPANAYYTKMLTMTKPLSYQIDVGINMRMLEKVVDAGHVTTNALYALAHQARKFLRDVEVSSDTLHKPRTPKVSSIIKEQPSTITGVKLHQYQLDAINWMVHWERDPKLFSLTPLIPVPKSDMLMRIDELKFVKRDQIQYNILPYTCKGGILADEIGLGKSLEVIGLIVANPQTEPPKDAACFSTKATLLVCPGHLVKQWSDEIAKHCENKLRVIELPTIKQVRKWTYQDIIDADVVIMSYEMLFSDHFCAHPDKIEYGVDRKENSKMRQQRLARLLETRKKIAPSKIKGVVMEHFHWHRIVADEFHEMILSHFKDYQRTYSWAVSGTPTLDTVVSFIGLEVTSEVPSEESEECGPIIFPEGWEYLTYLEKKLVVENLIWRNTKESVQKEFEMVKSTEEVIMLNFTPLETSIYEYIRDDPETTSRKDLLKFCCQLSEETDENYISLQQLKEYYIKTLKSSIASCNRKMDALTKEYTGAVTNLTDKYFKWKHSEYREIIRTYPDKSKAIQEQIDFLSESIAKIDSQKASGFKNAMIDKYGTKLGNLVTYMRKLFREDKEARVIIFSKYGPYLRLIGSILKASRITYTVAGGNVLVKANAIRKFKEENVRVILLNFNTDSSGLTLIEASHVILMDPMNGNKDKVLAYEKQAIGRAKRQGQRKDVTVVKFIVKNTLEEEIHKQRV